MTEDDANSSSTPLTHSIISNWLLLYGATLKMQKRSPRLLVPVIKLANFKVNAQPRDHLTAVFAFFVGQQKLIKTSSDKFMMRLLLKGEGIQIFYRSQECTRVLIGIWIHQMDRDLRNLVDWLPWGIKRGSDASWFILQRRLKVNCHRCIFKPQLCRKRNWLNWEQPRRAELLTSQTTTVSEKKEGMPWKHVRSEWPWKMDNRWYYGYTGRR